MVGILLLPPTISTLYISSLFSLLDSKHSLRDKDLAADVKHNL